MHDKVSVIKSRIHPIVRSEDSAPVVIPPVVSGIDADRLDRLLCSQCHVKTLVDRYSQCLISPAGDSQLHQVAGIAQYRNMLLTEILILAASFTKPDLHIDKLVSPCIDIYNHVINYLIRFFVDGFHSIACLSGDLYHHPPLVSFREWDCEPIFLQLPEIGRKSRIISFDRVCHRPIRSLEDFLLIRKDLFFILLRNSVFDDHNLRIFRFFINKKIFYLDDFLII